MRVPWGRVLLCAALIAVLGVAVSPAPSADAGNPTYVYLTINLGGNGSGAWQTTDGQIDCRIVNGVVDPDPRNACDGQYAYGETVFSNLVPVAGNCASTGRECSATVLSLSYVLTADKTDTGLFFILVASPQPSLDPTASPAPSPTPKPTATPKPTKTPPPTPPPTPTPEQTPSPPPTAPGVVPTIVASPTPPPVAPVGPTPTPSPQPPLVVIGGYQFPWTPLVVIILILVVAGLLAVRHGRRTRRRPY